MFFFNFFMTLYDNQSSPHYRYRDTECDYTLMVIQSAMTSGLMLIPQTSILLAGVKKQVISFSLLKVRKKKKGVQETINSTENWLSWLCMFHFQYVFIVELDLSGLKGRGVTKIVNDKRTKQLPFDIPKD